MKLSIIIPAHNEEENIERVIERIERDVATRHKVVVVNDHSTDATGAIVRRLMCKYPHIRQVENIAEAGFANAIKTGFAQADTEFVIPVMGDLCDDLNTIDAMIQKISEGYDIVCGARYMRGGKRVGGSKIKAFLSRWAGVSLYYLLGIPTHDIANAFKLYRKNVIESIAIAAKGFEISMEIPLKAYYLGFKIAEVPTVWKEREKGTSKFNVAKLLPGYCRLYCFAVKKRLTR